MKLKLLLFLFTFGISTSVSAEIVLYCNSELATGIAKQNGIYRTSDFVPSRYTVKFDDDYSRVKGLDEHRIWECKNPFNNKNSNTVVCISEYNVGETFAYDRKTKRFMNYSAAASGFVENNTDTNTMTAGTCEKF